MWTFERGEVETVVANPGAARTSSEEAEATSIADRGRDPARAERSTRARHFATVRALVRRLASIVLALTLTTGCARCSTSRDAPDGGSRHDPPPPEAILPPPAPWTFARTRADADLALPERCRLRAPSARAEVPPTTRFVADPRSLATLVVADSTGDPPRLTGVAAITLDPAGISRDPCSIPWNDSAALPHLARGKDGWIGALDRISAGTPRVVLWRAGTAESLGEGDGFQAADLACDAARCALLTTRLATVAQPGAALWIGAPADPASAWKKVEIVPGSSESDAHPIAIAALEDARVTAVVMEKGDAVFHAVEGAAAREIARIPTPHGALDLAALPAPVVLGSASAIDDEGCPRDGRAGVRLARSGQPAIEWAMPGPPITGAIRRLGRGALALWSVPAGCHLPRRVLYAVVLDPQGAAAGTPVPIGDVTSFAAASSGDDVDLYVQDPTGVTWLRMSCTAP